MLVQNGYSIPASPPTHPKEKREYECNVGAMNAILSGLLDTVSSKVDRCKSTKSLWDRLKKLYGNEPTTAGSDCESKKNNETKKCVNYKGKSVSSCNKDDNESQSFMVQETQDEERTSCCDTISSSCGQGFFRSDGDEDDGDVELDFGGELLCSLEEWKEFKDYKKSATKEQDLLRKTLKNQIIVLQLWQLN